MISRLRSINKTLFIALTLIWFLIARNSACFADNNMKAPFPQNKAAANSPIRETSTISWVMKGMIGFYSSVISPADGPRSPSYPTGSAYGKIAVQKYGFLPGIILIADRLIHETDVNLGPVVTLYGKDRFFDPINFNTYWWDRSVLEDGSRTDNQK